MEEEIYEPIIKMETEVDGGSWVHQNMEDLLEIKNEDRSLELENAEEKLVNENSNEQEEKYLMHRNRVCPYKKKIEIEENSGSGIRDVEDHSENCEKISSSNLSSNHQKDRENGNMDEKVGLDVEEKEFQQNCFELFINDEPIINHKEDKEKLKCLHNYNNCLTSSSLKQQVMVKHQKEYYENDYAKGIKPKSEHNVDLCQATEETSLLPTEKKYECHYKAHEFTLRENQCNLCSFVAAPKGDLLTHVEASHPRRKSYKCNECSYVASRKYTLLTHIKSRHTKDKPYKCNKCSYASARKDNLAYHIDSIHTKEKPYKCNKCSYGALRKDHLLTHIKSNHTMEKHYKCTECSFATARKYDLVIHIKGQHTLEKLCRKKGYPIHDMFEEHRTETKTINVICMQVQCDQK